MRTGKIIEDALEKSNLTLSKVAKRIGVSKAHLSNWKNGKSEPSDTIARAVARELGINFENLRLYLDKERSERKKYKYMKSYLELEKNQREIFVSESDENTTVLAGNVIIEEIMENPIVEIDIDIYRKAEEYANIHNTTVKKILEDYLKTIIT